MLYRRRYAEFAANQVKHYGNSGIKYQYISMPYSLYSESAEDTLFVFVYRVLTFFNSKISTVVVLS